MIRTFLPAIVSLFITIVLGVFTIPLLKRLKLGQPILKYVEAHKDKNGTPTMGGLFFIIPSCLVFLICHGLSISVALVSMIIGFAYMLVGFIDDFLKIRYAHNEGLKPYQKIIFQSSIALIAGVFAFVNGLSSINLPFICESLDLGWWIIPLVAFVFLGMTNSVNLTDGLDGLASSVSLVYLIIITVLISLQMDKHVSLNEEESEGILTLSACLIGGIMGFLVFNTSRAKVFMGDTGSLALGGFISSISIFTKNILFIPIIGIMFVISSISVIVQVAYFKKTKRRVFLMAPLHHHFQLKGVPEPKIAYVYSLITFVAGALSLLTYS